MEKYANLLVVIGASAGGFDPLRELLSLLPETFQATVIVATHRSPDHKSMLKEILENRANLKVCEPVDGEKLCCTTVYVGESDELVMTEGRDLAVEKITSAASRLERIDDLFFSAAESAAENAIGVILSGMLYDGVSGLQAIHEAGGRCFAQDPAEATFKSMPQTALENVPIDFCGTVEAIANELLSIAEGRQCR